jgi:hypothetical protein
MRNCDSGLRPESCIENGCFIYMCWVMCIEKRHLLYMCFCGNGIAFGVPEGWVAHRNHSALRRRASRRRLFGRSAPH